MHIVTFLCCCFSGLPIVYSVHYGTETILPVSSFHSRNRLVRRAEGVILMTLVLSGKELAEN